MTEGSGCGKCKRVHEQIAQILPFRVLEAAEGKPLRIAGVAMTASMSLNRNVYTSEELEAFAPKLVGAPIYLEHVAVESAYGKALTAFSMPKVSCKCVDDELNGPC